MTGEKPDQMIRTPMQGNAEESAGFTTGHPWDPVNADYETVNVAAATSDPDSPLSHYRRLIHTRNDHISLRRGELLPLEDSCKPVYGYLRQHEGEDILFLLNFAAEEQRDVPSHCLAGPSPPVTTWSKTFWRARRWIH